MENLKIRVANETESKEAQELFFELGYYWAYKNLGKELLLSKKDVYLFAESDGTLGTGTHQDEVFFNNWRGKEITLQELRDMVNPMKEYLEKQADGSYKLVCGVGVNDLPNLTRINGKQGKDYQLWRDMLRRSFSDVSDFARSAYKDVTCCDEWLIFSSFINDIREKSGYGNDGWHLDKDILIKGNKIYSRDTVCFVPKKINNLLTKNNKNRGGLPIGVYFQKERSSFVSMISINGKQKRLGSYKNPIDAFNVYKREKERFIKIKAEEYKDTLDPIVFDALIKYEVDIND